MIVIEHHYADGQAGTVEVPDGSLHKVVTVRSTEEPVQLPYSPFMVPTGGRIEAYADPDPGCPHCGEVGGKPMVREDVDRESGYSCLVDCCSLCYWGPNTSRAGISVPGSDADCFVSGIGDSNAE